MKYAVENDMMVVTADLDFGHISHIPRVISHPLSFFD